MKSLIVNVRLGLLKRLKVIVRFPSPSIVKRLSLNQPGLDSVRSSQIRGANPEATRSISYSLSDNPFTVLIWTLPYCEPSVWTCETVWSSRTKDRNWAQAIVYPHTSKITHSLKGFYLHDIYSQANVLDSDFRASLAQKSTSINDFIVVDLRTVRGKRRSVIGHVLTM